MLRCSTAGAPITFGIWSHTDAELDSLYAILVRYNALQSGKYFSELSLIVCFLSGSLSEFHSGLH